MKHFDTGIRVLACCFAVGLVAACGTGPRGSSYQAGYVQGCDAGRVNAGYVGTFVKDENRFRTDRGYRDAWQRGHDTCYEEAIRYSFGGPDGAG